MMILRSGRTREIRYTVSTSTLTCITLSSKDYSVKTLRRSISPNSRSFAWDCSRWWMIILSGWVSRADASQSMVRCSISRLAINGVSSTQALTLRGTTSRSSRLSPCHTQWFKSHSSSRGQPTPLFSSMILAVARFATSVQIESMFNCFSFWTINWCWSNSKTALTERKKIKRVENMTTKKRRTGPYSTSMGISYRFPN